MEIPLISMPKEKTSVWDQYVPIVKTPTGYRIYVTDEMESPDNYNEAYNTIRNAEKHEIVEFIINTPGGVIDTALMLVDAIRLSKGKTIAYLSGSVASAGTLLTLACDKVEVADSTIFMIHNYSAGAHGKLCHSA